MNMKKNIFSFLALALVFAGCTKEANEEVVAPSNDEGVKLVVEATIGGPETRMSYTEDGNGFKAKFYGNETMQVYFLDSKDSVSSKVALNIDQASISADGSSAKFEAIQGVNIPDDAVKVVSFISNPGVAFDAKKVTVDLSEQKDMNEANNRHVILGSANASEIKTETGTALVKIAYSYKTSVLRFKLKLGDGVDAKVGTEIKLFSVDNTIHNKLELVGGELASTSETGDIVFRTTAVDTSSHVITGYATVWAADALKNARLTATYGDDTYSVDLKPSKETLEAGKAYTVTRTLTVSPKPVTVMKNDEAGSMNFAYSGGEDVTNDWLSCKSGVVSWTANTTGVPRQATLNFKNGALCTVTQVAPADLKGSYTFYNYSFKSSGVSDTKVVNQDNRQHETAVQFKAVENPTTVNGHVHNLDLVGLYLDFAVPASFEIVDDAPVIYTYLSLDYQKVSNGTEVACIPELTNTTSYGTGYFAPLKFGVNDCNYAWIAWGVDDLLGTPKFGLGTGAQRLVSEGMYCCGFSFVVNGYKEGSYTTIYQFNYNNKWVYDETAGAGYFAKK